METALRIRRRTCSRERKAKEPAMAEQKGAVNYHDTWQFLPGTGSLSGQQTYLGRGMI